MLLASFTQCDDRRLLENGNRFALARTGNRGPFLVVEWIPEAFRFAVEDDEYVLVDVTADTELIDLIIAFPAVNHSQLGQRSPADGDGLALEHVVHEFMVIEQSDRVRAGLSFHDKTQDAQFVVGLGRLGLPIDVSAECQQP